MPNTPPNLFAREDINPSRFITLSTSTDFGAEEADANQKIVGISMEGSREAPIPSVTTPLAAQNGEPLRIYGDGDECLLKIGDTVTAGDRLKSDADGKGVPISGAGDDLQYIGALALESGASDELIRVQVQIYSERSVATS